MRSLVIYLYQESWLIFTTTVLLPLIDKISSEKDRAVLQWSWFVSRDISLDSSAAFTLANSTYIEHPPNYTHFGAGETSI